MIISFCGPSKLYGSENLEEKLLAFLNEVITDERTNFYLRDSGAFDAFAYNACKRYQVIHSNVRLTFVTPYITEQYCEKLIPKLREKYDMIVYPEIEDKPLRLALLHRNQWMIKVADVVVTHVDRHSGGLYRLYMNAKKNGKKVFNLSNMKL
ncbi:MAG: hypothetical protein E7609_06700 [Ruminococcaceae bacterium]|nr:hypothetical protein [Oscillospiraceae bacterium]